MTRIPTCPHTCRRFPFGDDPDATLETARHLIETATGALFYVSDEGGDPRPIATVLRIVDRLLSEVQRKGRSTPV